jgi:LDH2 family malate/lactate/ureidoglycolate dehydrogenase
MRVDAFRPAEEFYEHMDKWIRRFRNAEAVEGKNVLIPGDPEREMEAVRTHEGIPVVARVVEDLMIVGDTFGVPLPEEFQKEK